MAVCKESKNGNVTFIYDKNNAKSVFVAGDFNNWDPKAGKMKKTKDGSFRVRLVLAPGRYQYKFVADGIWVVDEDIDIYNDEEIIWAMATRFQGDKDLLVINNIMGSELDPSAKDGNKAAKVGFDCTKPAPPEPFERKVEISREIVEKVKKAGYLTEDDLKRLV